jgi:DNA-binding NarL/FixJ family response regulator
MFFETMDNRLKEQGSVLVDLLDVLLNNATARQCNILHYKLLGFSELDIAQKLGVNQAAVNQHSTAVGWNAIEHTLKYYEQLEF